ncbi:uncharacterized protein I303_103543 [Kwoniella dejecticola CBS 10117]|uniref:Uncharacterized protein n=1 Tax=Kwoniella dejecticola CBS 10117 TaxID=1296121 RepID=A0A1A6A720_9TREE|nr:uncharacterized protein I303_03565 [Kwoniella dejecticola CBS 10117]OBR85851.1 hypothetical protein I303_03565 [Kwoniella dejecticola CBS 10117]
MEYLIFSPSATTAQPTAIHATFLPSPIEPGYAIQAINHFADSLRCMQGATFDEWDSFIDEHFEQSARFQLNIHTGDALKSFDVPIISLPRFFLTISGEDNNLSHELVLGEISEPAIGSVESEHVEWSYGAQPLKGNLSAELAMSGGGAGILRLGRLELSLQVVEGTFPESALRILEIAQQMDCMMEVIDLVEEDKLDPQDALKRLDQDTDTDTEIGGVSIHDTNT